MSMADDYQNYYQDYTFSPSLSRQMSVESEQGNDIDESVSFIEAGLSILHFEPGDHVLCRNEQGVVVPNFYSDQVWVSHGDGRVEHVHPSELHLVKKCDDMQAPVQKVPIDFEDLGCVLCHDILCEPVSLSCGHTFCRLCITMTLQRSSKKCPICRAICHIAPLSQPENIVLSQICKKAFPEEYARKEMETKAQMEKVKRSHPVFSYNSVQFPNSTMSLCLIDDSIKIMMRRCIRADQKFVYVGSAEPAKIGQIGFLCRVCQFETDVQNAEVHDNSGKLLFFDNLTIKMERRIIITSTWTEQGAYNLPYVQYDFYDDHEGVTVDEESKDSFIQGAWKDLTGLFHFMESNDEQNALGPPPPIKNFDQCIWWASSILDAMRQFHEDDVDLMLRARSLQTRLEIINKIRSPQRAQATQHDTQTAV